jgi:ATP-binding cassette subfamily B protein
MARPMGGPPGSNFAPKTKNARAALKKLLRQMRIIKTQTILVLLLTVFSVALAVYTPKLTEKAITELFRGYFNLPVDLAYIANIILIAGALYLLSSLFQIASRYIMGGASQKMVYELRKKVRAKLDRVPLNYYDTSSTGDLISRVTNDLDNIGSSLNQSITQLLHNLLTIVGVVVMMFSINIWLTFISLASIPFSMLFAKVVVKRTQKYFALQAKNLGSVSGKVEESYTNQKIVKAFHKEAQTLKEFEALNETLKNTAIKANFFSGLIYPIINFINNFGFVIVTICASIFIANGTLNPGYLIVFLQYTDQLTQPLGQIAQLSSVIQTLLASTERVFEVLETKEEVKNSVDATELNKIKGQVSFKNVTFGYEPDVPFMQNVNFEVTPGKMIAIVGPTGAGKTTIVNLIMRFYELNGGSILIDNNNITNITRESLRKQIGMVLQDTWLFYGTIKENIAYGKKEASMEEIVAASKLAQAHHFIQTLPHGYDTVINEDSTNISEGQKQLLTIARAILADPKILILDEATSSVDTRTEILIQTAFQNLLKNKTSFVIAHRLSTIQDADIILVMNEGNIIEHGSHQELLEKNGFYAELFNSQFA